MNVFVHQGPVCSAVVFRPLSLDVDKRPLAAAEGKMLETKELEIVLFLPAHTSLWQVTPDGSAVSSTVT